MYLVISLWVLRAGCGIWLYQFLIIAYLFTSQCRPSSDCSQRWPISDCFCSSSLIRVYIICHSVFIFWKQLCTFQVFGKLQQCFLTPFFFFKWIYLYTFEPPHDKTNKMACGPSEDSDLRSESSLCTQWVAKDPRFLHADNEDSDQTGRMPRLIRVFPGRTIILLVFSWGGSVLTVQTWNLQWNWTSHL